MNIAVLYAFCLYMVKMKITLAFDSFKGSLSSLAVAEAFEEGLRTVYGDCEILKFPIADGGEGTAEALVSALGGTMVECSVDDPLGRPVAARYGIIDNGATAVIEMAEASGLTLLRPEERNPLYTSTRGFGELILDALGRGCRRLLLGIGGSATNDAGMGMMQAFGYRFLDSSGVELSACGASLGSVAKIDASLVPAIVRGAEFIVACDVVNPFCGKEGAAYVFAPQKGADDAMVSLLDKGLYHFAERIKECTGVDVRDMQGAGAAGGVGGALAAMLGAQLMPGAQMVLDALHFDERVAGSDFIVTGEGRIDAQTLMGKAPAAVLQRALRLDIPVIAVGGTVVWCDELRKSPFKAIVPLVTDDTPLEEAMKPSVTRENLRRVAKEVR